MTADELPLAGPAWGLRNFWLAEGVPGGILWGGALGYYRAEGIGEGGTSIDMSEVDPRRFGAYCNKAWTRLKVHREPAGAHVGSHLDEPSRPTPCLIAASIGYSAGRGDDGPVASGRGRPAPAAPPAGARP